MAYELLRRNLLSAVVVETVSTRLLFGIFFVVSLVYAMMVWIILKAATSLGRDAYYVTAFCVDGAFRDSRLLCSYSGQCDRHSLYLLCNR